MKHLTKITLLILSILILIGIFQIIYSYNAIDNTLIEYRIYSQSEKIQKIIKNYEVIECKFSLFNPVYSIAAYKYYSEDRESYDVAFYSPVRSHILSNKWQIEYIGGADIKNTTFPELVKMVKEDCSQFQKGHGDYYGEDLAWSYSPAPTQEELDKDHIDSMRSDFIDLSEESREIFYRVYDVNHKDMIISDEKTLEVYNKIEKDGGLHTDIEAQLQLEEDEYQRKVESGEIVIPTREEKLRNNNIPEDKIKIILEAEGEEYVGL